MSVNAELYPFVEEFPNQQNIPLVGWYVAVAQDRVIVLQSQGGLNAEVTFPYVVLTIVRYH